MGTRSKKPTGKPKKATLSKVPEQPDDVLTGYDGEGRPQISFETGAPLVVRISFLAHERIEKPQFGLALHDGMAPVSRASMNSPKVTALVLAR